MTCWAKAVRDYKPLTQDAGAFYEHS